MGKNCHRFQFSSDLKIFIENGKISSLKEDEWNYEQITSKALILDGSLRTLTCSRIQDFFPVFIHEQKGGVFVFSKCSEFESPGKNSSFSGSSLDNIHTKDTGFDQQEAIMVRHCAVRSCKNTDLTILCHRFPKRKDAFHQWQRSLRLDDFDVNILMQRFVVCTSHFKPSDYRNANSRMLNAVAVPSLAYSEKVKFIAWGETGEADELLCDKRKSTTGESSDGLPRIDEDEASKNTEEESVSADDGCTLIIEQLEEIDTLDGFEDGCQDDMVYFIEETDVNEDHTSRTVTPVEEPELEESETKRIKLDDTPPVQPQTSDLDAELQPEPGPLEVSKSPLQAPQAASVCYRNSLVQTDDVQIVSEEDQLQRRMVEEFYPEYADCSRLDLAKQLKDREERLTELTKKLANFEAAHSAMMKTMEAFKTLVS